MVNLSSDDFKYNPEPIKKLFSTVGNSIVTKGSVRVIFPSIYLNKELGEIDNGVNVISIYAVVDDNDNYAVVNKPIFAKLTPDDISEIEINDKPHKVLHFSKNTVFIENRKLVKNNSFLFNLFDLFFLQGKVPWFLSYEKTARIFEHAKDYAGSKIGNNPIALEILTAIITRLQDDKTKFYRQVIEKPSDLKKIKRTTIGLMNIYYTFDNTTAKLVGSYYNEGVNSALVNQETKSTNIEKLLRA